MPLHFRLEEWGLARRDEGSGNMKRKSSSGIKLNTKEFVGGLAQPSVRTRLEATALFRDLER